MHGSATSRVEKVKSEQKLIMVPVSQGSSPQKKAASQGRRGRRQEARERSAVQLGMALERALGTIPLRWQHDRAVRVARDSRW